MNLSPPVWCTPGQLFILLLSCCFFMLFFFWWATISLMQGHNTAGSARVRNSPGISQINAVSETKTHAIFPFVWTIPSFFTPGSRNDLLISPPSNNDPKRLTPTSQRISMTAETRTYEDHDIRLSSLNPHHNHHTITIMIIRWSQKNGQMFRRK